MPSLAPSPALADRLEPNDSLLQPANVGAIGDWQTVWPFSALSVHNSRDQDFYWFRVDSLITRPFILDLSIDNPLVDLDLYLYDELLNLIRSSVSGTAGQPEHLNLQDLQSGDYILEVSVFDSESLSPGIATTYQLRPGNGVEAADHPTAISGNLFSIALPATPVAGQLLVSDTDGFDPTGIFTLTAPPLHGTAGINTQSGIWSYISAPDYTGEDSFVVTIEDRLGHTTEQRIVTSVIPISLSLKPLGAVVGGIPASVTALPENPGPLPEGFSTGNGSVDLTTVNRLSFAMRAELNPEQAMILEQQPPAVPIRFRLDLEPAAAQQQPTISSEDLLLSVVAVDPSPIIIGTTNPSVNLLPDSNGFYEWPIFDRQTSGQGFVLANLEINAIPLADNRQEGIETGVFSIVDLIGAIFPNPDGTGTQIAPNQGQLAFADPLSSSSSATFNLDVDGDGAVTALGDGLMVIRKLFGSAFTGTALTNKAMSTEATRSAEQIHTFIEGGIRNGLLDVDHDGQTTALGDGLMIIRRLFGGAFEGNQLIQKAIATESPYFGTAMAYQSVAANIDALRPSTAPGNMM